jgi:mannose-6-phosphate isomerase-like protein (cupin superfamily)
MSLHRGSLDADPAPSIGERFRELSRIRNVVVESIVSSSSPDDVEYRQVQDEWVVVLEGAAVLEVDGAKVRLAPGDWLLLPAATPHRVLMTEAGTRWLAVHVHVRADSTGNPPV